MSGTTLTIRAALLSELIQQQKEGGGSEGPSAAEAIVHSVPALGDPAWAMEELMRTCPRPELWSGSALPRTVWAPPGTKECPFGTGPGDFAR